MTNAHAAFRAARDQLLRTREDYDAAYTAFAWPQPEQFNWSLDWFDAIAADRPALWIVGEDGGEVKLTYGALSQQSNRVANWLRELGVSRGDRILLMLGSRQELWETFLAAMKLGAVIVPTSPLMGAAELRDRVARGRVRYVIADAAYCATFGDVGGDYVRIAVGDDVAGWERYADSASAPTSFEPGAPTRSADPLLLYFTSGTTSQPKLVQHTHASYPIGHLSTMYWLGLRPGDVHLNVASPGWAKHAWSNFFAPWTAEATIFVYDYARFDAPAMLDRIARFGVTTMCAPPTVWRMLVQQDLSQWDVALRELVGAGEPLNPEVIEQVRRAWGITVRDGFGQTETTAQIGNPPGAAVKDGAMGRPLPGYEVALVDVLTGKEGDEGEICLPLDRRPTGLMTGYLGAEELTAKVMRDGYYHTGDIASRDADGYLTYVGRADDVFKASDYRISPFELESVLIEHPACAEAAVVPSPDPLRLAVPKAYVALAEGHAADGATAESILAYARDHLAPFKRVRRIEFAELPKTVSGKIRRVDLRLQEERRHASGTAERAQREFWEEDFSDR
jgi:acetyl-CoA synthetase